MSRLRRAWCWVLGVKPYDDEESAPAVIEPFTVPGRLSWPAPGPAWEAREDRLLGRVGALTDEGVPAWEAAFRVFGGAGVAREASRAGLSATLAGVQRDSVRS